MPNIQECIAQRPTWDEEFFTDVIKWAKKSPDPSSQVGCVITTPDHLPISFGYNAPVRGVDLNDPYVQEQLTTRPNKYKWFEHGERNAIYNACRQATTLDGAVLYILGIPCSDCARGICQTGIKRVKILKETNDIWSKHPNWEEDSKASLYFFANRKSSAGMPDPVEVEYCDVKIMVPMSIRINSQDCLIGAGP